MRVLIATLLLLSVTACGFVGFPGVYKINIEQGNIITQDIIDQLEPGIHEIISRDAMPPFRSVPVVKSALGDDSGLFGAASLVLDASGA